MIFIEGNKLLSNYQHGFRCKSSTTTNLINFTKFINDAFNNNNEVHCCFLDFNKAFDAISHRHLVDTLSKLGFPLVFTRLINSYLSMHMQLVSINNQNSEPTICASEVPQGSVLGPILFNLFVNDLGNVINQCSYLQFADDLKLFKVISNSNRLSDMHDMQSDLDNILKWCNNCNLHLNKDKCKLMVFHKMKSTMNSSSCAFYHLYGENIQKVNNHLDLGVLYDSSIDFNAHIKQIITKANRAKAIMSRCFSFSSVIIKLHLYKAFIWPILKYACQLWNLTSSKLISDLEKVQRSFTRHLDQNNFMNDYATHLSTYQLHSLEDRRAILDACFMYKVCHDSVNLTNLSDLELQFVSSEHHKYNFVQKMSRSNCISHEFSRKIISTWNQLPDKIKESPSFNGFKQSLLNFYSSNQ